VVRASTVNNDHDALQTSLPSSFAWGRRLGGRPLDRGMLFHGRRPVRTCRAVLPTWGAHHGPAVNHPAPRLVRIPRTSPLHGQTAPQSDGARANYPCTQHFSPL